MNVTAENTHTLLVQCIIYIYYLWLVHLSVCGKYFCNARVSASTKPPPSSETVSCKCTRISTYFLIRRMALITFWCDDTHINYHLLRLQSFYCIEDTFSHLALIG